MPETIELLDRGVGDGVLLYVLRIDTHHPLPLLVGCSFQGHGKDHRELVVDVPPRKLRRTGIAVWRVPRPTFYAPTPEPSYTGPRDLHAPRIPTTVRFSTWTPHFQTRLADTWWVDDRPMRLLTPEQYRAARRRADTAGQDA